MVLSSDTTDFTTAGFSYDEFALGADRQRFFCFALLMNGILLTV